MGLAMGVTPAIGPDGLKVESRMVERRRGVSPNVGLALANRIQAVEAGLEAVRRTHADGLREMNLILSNFQSHVSECFRFYDEAGAQRATAGIRRGEELTKALKDDLEVGVRTLQSNIAVIRGEQANALMTVGTHIDRVASAVAAVEHRLADSIAEARTAMLAELGSEVQTLTLCQQLGFSALTGRLDHLGWRLTTLEQKTVLGMIRRAWLRLWSILSMRR